MKPRMSKELIERMQRMMDGDSSVEDCDNGGNQRQKQAGLKLMPQRERKRKDVIVVVMVNRPF